MTAPARLEEFSRMTRGAIPTAGCLRRAHAVYAALLVGGRVLDLATPPGWTAVELSSPELERLSHYRASSVRRARRDLERAQLVHVVRPGRGRTVTVVAVSTGALRRAREGR